MEITRRKFLEVTAASAAVGVANAQAADKQSLAPAGQLQDQISDIRYQIKVEGRETMCASRIF
jgi:hypothetical protein